MNRSNQIHSTDFVTSVYATMRHGNRYTQSYQKTFYLNLSRFVDYPHRFHALPPHIQICLLLKCVLHCCRRYCYQKTPQSASTTPNVKWSGKPRRTHCTQTSLFRPSRTFENWFFLNRPRQNSSVCFAVRSQHFLSLAAIIASCLF